MRTREEIEAKIAEIDAAEGDHGLTPQNGGFKEELEYALGFVDSDAEEYSWHAAATSWANGDIETLRIEGEVEPPGELEPVA